MTDSSENVHSIDGTNDGAMAQAHREADEANRKKAPEAEPLGLTAESLFDQELMSELRAFENKLSRIDDERAELNASKAEAMAKLVNKGFNKDAVKAAIKYYRTDVDKRENFDLSYQITRQALGVPMQDDLFVAAAQRTVDRHQAGKKGH